MAVTSACKDNSRTGFDNGKYVRYTPEQVETLERVYYECPKPSALRRQQLIRECPILSNIEPKQIKVWFQNRRCREKQRKESSRLQSVNRKLSAMNKLLMEENERLQKQVSQLVYENTSFRQSSHNATDNSCDSVVTSGQHNLTLQHSLREASPAGLLSFAEETLTEFLSKATGTAVKWIQMPGMKPGPDSIGIVAISHGCSGVASRACCLVGLEPTRVAEILKDKRSWYRDCRAVDIVNVLSTATGGTIELLYMQLYAPTTMAPARDFWLLRYTSVMEDGTLSVCERSLNNARNGPSMPLVQHFVRGEILPSGYLIRPCEGGGSIIHIVDHHDLESWNAPEFIRMLYKSSTLLAQRTTLAALRHLKQISHETCLPNNALSRIPALQALSRRLNRGFNEAVNVFADEGWSMMESDGLDDVTVHVNSSPGKLTETIQNYSMCNAVLSAKASILLQNVSPAVVLRFLREHRSEWADSGIDAYSAAAAVKAGGSYSLPVSGGACFGGGHIVLPLGSTVENDEFMEVIKLENVAQFGQDGAVPNDIFLLQVYNGVDEGGVGELIFAPIDASFSDDAPLLSSGFRVIPLDAESDPSSPNRTLDLASTLEVGSFRCIDGGRNNGVSRSSVMTVAFQFAFGVHLQEESVAAMARQYIRNVISSLQRVASALSPPRAPPPCFHATPEAQTLARWICSSYRFYLGTEMWQMERNGGGGGGGILKALWHHSDAVLCCGSSSKAFTFANQAGLDMLETSLIALQDIALQDIFDDDGRKAVLAELLRRTMKHGFGCVDGGICVSSMGRPLSYQKMVAWKVLNQDEEEEEEAHCICIMFVNWSFL